MAFNARKNRLTVISTVTVSMLSLALSARAQNLTVQGTGTFQGAGNHSFMGNVGVGTTTPAARLDVAAVEWPTAAIRFSAALINPSLALTNTTAAGRDWRLISAGTGSGPDGALRFYDKTAGVDRLVLSAAGNVGIGTTAPGAKLDLVGNLIVRLAAGGTAVNVSNGTDDDFQVRLSAVAAVDKYSMIGPGTATGLALMTGGVEKARLTSAGNFGLGATAAAARLQLGTSYAATLQDNYSCNADTVIAHNAYPTAITCGTARQLKWVTTHASFGSRAIAFGFVDGISFFADAVASTAGTAFTPTARMIITNAGNVGIGTTAPAYKLHVNGTAAGTSWTNLSSRDFKQEIRYVSAAEYETMLAQVLAMKPARYRYRDEYNGGDDSTRLGFIAEEMPADVLSPNGKGVDTYELVTYLAGAIKAQQAQLKAQAEHIRRLEDRIAE